jgi:hypothetical protein
MTNQTIKNRIGRELHNLTTSVYFPAIPLDTIFSIVEKHAGIVIQEDGTPWSGFLCGDDGLASFGVKDKKFFLFLIWHKMPSGNFEITAYVS